MELNFVTVLASLVRYIILVLVQNSGIVLIIMVTNIDEVSASNWTCGH